MFGLITLTTCNKLCVVGVRPFPSYPTPLFQSKGKCKTIHMNFFFIFMQINFFFHKKGFALGIVLKGRVFETWKWPVGCKVFLHPPIILHSFPCFFVSLVSFLV